MTETLLPYEDGDVLELDELWSFVSCKTNIGFTIRCCWIWVARCRRIRQVVSWVLGNHDEERCQTLWELVAEAYRKSMIHSDFYATYEKVLQNAQHQSVGNGRRYG